MTARTVIDGLGWLAGYCATPLALALAAVLLLTGCGTMPRTRSPQVEVWPDMRRQEKFKPQQETVLFGDGRTSRRPPEGTVARGYLKGGGAFHSGLESEAMYTGKNPVAIDAALLKLGQARFNVYCTPCHDAAGTGKGTVALKAPTLLPTNLHDERIRKTADGEIFNVISNGKRSMSGYRFQITDERDRWAIVAYVRALQRMSSGTVDDVPAELKTALPDSKSPALLPPPPPPAVSAPAATPAGTVQK